MNLLYYTAQDLVFTMFKEFVLLGTVFHAAFASVRYPLVKRYEDALAALENAASTLRQSDGDDDCPPVKISIQNRYFDVDIEQTRLIAGGSGTLVLAYGDKYAVKTIGRSSSALVEELFRNEKAMMQVSFDDAIIPTLFRVNIFKTRGLSEFCESRFIVTRRGGLSLRDSLVSEDIIQNPKIVFLYGLHGLEILRKLHQLGFVHGDIHASNFLIGAGGLRLIDYGMSLPYVDEYGTHISEQAITGFTLENASYAHLSVWHLESDHLATYRQTRRDDLYRFAEMLYGLAVPEYARDLSDVGFEAGFLEDVDRVVRFKRLYLHRRGPRVFCDFIKYASELSYEEEPDYATWIFKFGAAYREL